jgi:hypothetical protein
MLKFKSFGNSSFVDFKPSFTLYRRVKSEGSSKMNSAYSQSSSSSSDSFNLEEVWDDLDFILDDSDSSESGNKKPNSADKIKLKVPAKHSKSDSRRKSDEKASENSELIGGKGSSTPSLEKSISNNKAEPAKTAAKRKSRAARNRKRMSESERKSHLVERKKAHSDKIKCAVDVMKVSVPGCSNIADKVALFK